MSLPKATGPRKGMQLGKAKKANDFLDSLRAEGEIIQARVPASLFLHPAHQPLCSTSGMLAHDSAASYIMYITANLQLRARHDWGLCCAPSGTVWPLLNLRSEWKYACAEAHAAHAGATP